jgi:hypothetical protein
MAFNFFGTFTTGQFDRFRTFSKLQEQDLKSRISWLRAELNRVGVFTTTYDPDGRPLQFSASPSNSYAAKLMLAYKILGGWPEYEMLLKTRDMPVFKVRGTALDPDDHDSGSSTMYSNGRRERSGQRFDRDVGLKASKVKAWQLEVVKRKRESLEFKIKKALDYSDQISQEIAQLTTMTADDSRSLDSLFVAVDAIMFAPGKQTVLSDAEDVFGLTIGNKVDATSSDDYNSAEAKGNIK